MAVQLPNFLNVPVQKPDYSGISNIFENYYAGKDMPREAEIRKYKAQEAPLDYLIKQIQSEFARPNAETALTGAKLGNRSTELSNRQAEMAIKKLQQELRNQAEVESAIREALTQGGSSMGSGSGGGMGGVSQANMMPQENNTEMMPRRTQPNMAPQAPSMMQNAPQEPSGAEAFRQQQNGLGLQQSLMQVMQHQAMKNQPMPTQAPVMTDHPEEVAERQNIARRNQPTMQEIEAGSPALYVIDALWDKKPQLRPYIAKTYDKKEVKPVYDKKTGQTQVYTKWPSGRITVKTVEPQFNEEDLEKGIPLTPQVLNKVVNQVRGSDAVMPYIDEILAMGDAQPDLNTKGKVIPGENNELPHFKGLPTDANANYQGLVSTALEKYMSAMGVNSTDLGTKKTEEILQRHWGESTKNYLNRLTREKKRMIEDRAKNVLMITKGLKKNPNIAYGSDDSKSYSSNDWEVTNE